MTAPARDSASATEVHGPREAVPTQLIANAIAVTYKEQYGKGPERIKVTVSEDTVVALLRGGYSVVEESLRKSGQSVAVRDQRRVFGDMIAPGLSAAVTQVIGREIVAVLADTCQDPDLGAIVFVLAARSAGGTPTAG
jgi:uncharacterized protein YbcI